MTRGGMIPRGVNKNPPKHDSPGYDTPVSLTRSGMIPQGVNLAVVSYPGESLDKMFHKISLGAANPGVSISLGSHAMASQTHWGMILL